jgi:light-regulated signal transduction histidine kinase (bacteriophytochrome)
MKPELKLTLLYTAIGTGWILFSDHILMWLLNETSVDELWKYQSFKGVFYVVTTGGLLYLLTKRYHESIQDKIRELENLNAQLQIQTQNLSSSNAELEQFAYTASHDLQEPLRMITSFMAQLERKYDEKLDEKAHQYIHFAMDGAKRMRKIILDLLEFSRVGKEKGALEIVSLEEIIDENCTELKRKITEKGAIIEYANLPHIYAFRHPIQQVLHHFLENALTFQKEGHIPKITISCEEYPAYWQIAVEDNGVGIEEPYLEKIFTIFQKLNEIHNPDGSGMGLAIVKKIIDNLNGQVWVKSTPEIGSTFYFTLPKFDSTS